MSIFTATKNLADKMGAETNGSNINDVLNNIAVNLGSDKHGTNIAETVNLIAENYKSNSVGETKRLLVGSTNSITGETDSEEA